MKILTKTLLCICGLIGAPLVLSAQDEKPYQLPKYKVEDITALPEITYAPTPKIHRRLVGTTIELEFTVNELGKALNVELAKAECIYNYRNPMAGYFATQMRRLISSDWKFEPARDDNNLPLAVKVRLPVQVVKKGTATTAIATMILDDGGKDKS